MDITLDAIRARRSVRSFDGTPLGPELGKAMEAAIREAAEGPFGGRPRFAILGREAGGFEQGKIGTYGVISKAPAFLVGAVERAAFAMEDFGYCLEGIILRATELGLGTCWLGGIFDRGAAAKALGAGPKDLVPACTPLGFAADRMSFRDRLIRFSAG
jgi:nitroreductase